MNEFSQIALTIVQQTEFKATRFSVVIVLYHL